MKLGQREYYNLRRDEAKGILSKSEQLDLLLSYLEAEDFRYRLLEEMETNPLTGEPRRVVEAILFASSEQIRLARLNVSAFVFIQDATFNTNQDRLPLEVLTGVDSTGKTFPFAQIFTTGETAEMFRFAEASINELCFHDIPGPAVSLGDFAAGITKADRKSREEEIRNAEREGGEPKKRWKLQYCNWHAAEAIKRKLVTRR